MTIRCHKCDVPLRPELAFYRDIRNRVEYCVRCAQALIIERTGLEFIPSFRGVRA